MTEHSSCSIKCVLLSWVGIVLIGIVGLVAYVGLGVYNIGADVPHWPATAGLIEGIRELSIETQSSKVTVSAGLDQPQRIADGAGLYDEMCTGCHLAPGKQDSELRRGLYPKPPDLPRDGIDDPKSAFWVIKHGIKLTAMPAWGESHTDDQIWSMVAFLGQIKGMSPERYQALVGAATPEEDDHHH